MTRVRGSNAWGDDIAWVKFVVESRHCKWRTTLGYATCKSLYIHLFVCLFIYLCIYLFILSRRICTITMHGPKFALLFFTFDRLVNPPWKLVLIPFFCRLLWYVFQLRRTMIIRGDWLWKPTNIKVENNGAVVYVHLEAPLPCTIFVFLFSNCEWMMFLLVSKFKMIVMLLNVLHGQVQKVTKTYNRQV